MKKYLIKNLLLKCYKITNIITDYIQFFVFNILRHINKKKYIVCDIDNTISDTWRQLYLNESIHDAKPIDKIIKYINSYENCQYIFLSSRPIHEYLRTISWLRLNVRKKFLLILTSSPKGKIKYLKIIEESIIVYLDDLSYNHENGTVKYYHDEIKIINKMNMPYIGYKEIDYIKNL